MNINNLLLNNKYKQFIKYEKYYYLIWMQDYLYIL